MDLSDLKKDKSYEILFEHPDLNSRIQYLTLGGSKAYGLSTPESDTDIRGFYLEKLEDILGLIRAREEFVFTDTDTVLYSFRRFIELLSDCNPSVLELIGTRKEDVIFSTDLAEEVRENYHLFLSKKAFKTFIGYASQQLRKLENAIARNEEYTQEDKERHMLKSFETQIVSGNIPLPDGIPSDSIHMDIKKREKDSRTFPRPEKRLSEEIFVSVHMDDIPLRDFLNTQSALKTTVRNFGKLNHRNRKKDKSHLYKYAMHLIRLHIMGAEVLEKEIVKTYRDKEHDFLMDIRNGKVPYSEIFRIAEENEKKLLEACQNSKLPDKPRMEEINAFTVKMIKKYLF